MRSVPLNLGNTIDGTQAGHVRIPYADTSLYAIPADADEEAVVMLSDILPTGFECGVLNGQVQPGDAVAIVGAGPVGLAALLTAQFYSPASIVMIDLDDKRLEVAKQLGATTLVNSTDGGATQRVMEMTAGYGVDVAIEAVGVPVTFDIGQAILAPGGAAGERRRSWRPCVLAPRETVGSQRHDHDPSRGHDHHADAAQGSAVRTATTAQAGDTPLPAG
jgi:threonine dehydrogenase-like Zn-dependent dehydrogenase